MDRELYDTIHHAVKEAGSRALIPKYAFGLVYCKGWGLSLEFENKN